MEDVLDGNCLRFYVGHLAEAPACCYMEFVSRSAI